MGVGGFKAVGRPPAPLTTEGDSLPSQGEGRGGVGGGLYLPPLGASIDAFGCSVFRRSSCHGLGGCRAGARSAGGGPKARRSRRGACPPRGGAALRGSSTGRGRRKTLKTLKVKKPRARVTRREKWPKPLIFQRLFLPAVGESTIGLWVIAQVHPQQNVGDSTSPSTGVGDSTTSRAGVCVGDSTIGQRRNGGRVLGRAQAGPVFGGALAAGVAVKHPP